MKIRIYLVPKATPNADAVGYVYAVTEAEWLAAILWCSNDMFIRWLVPDEFFTVRVEDAA